MSQDLLVDVPLGHELGMNILVALQFLPGEKPVLVEAIAHRRHVVPAAACDTAGGDMYQARFVPFAPGGNIPNRPDVCALYLITLCKVLDAGGTVDDRHALSRSTE